MIISPSRLSDTACLRTFFRSFVTFSFCTYTCRATRQCCWVLGTKNTSRKHCLHLSWPQLPAWHWHALADLQSPCNRAKRDSQRHRYQRKIRKQKKKNLLSSHHVIQASKTCRAVALCERETIGRGSTQIVCIHYSLCLLAR